MGTLVINESIDNFDIFQHVDLEYVLLTLNVYLPVFKISTQKT